MDELTEGRERRRRERVDVGAQVTIRISDMVCHADCINASMCGLLLNVFEPAGGGLPADLDGRRGEFSLQQVSGAERLSIEGSFEVVRTGPRVAGGGTFEMAVVLVDLDMEASVELFKLIRWNSWQP